MKELAHQLFTMARDSDRASEADFLAALERGILKEGGELRAEVNPAWLNEFHRVNVARQYEAFAPPHSLLGLIACVAEEVGELAGAALGVTGEKRRKLSLTNDDMLDAVADAITYLSLVADRGGCSNLQKLLGDTFNMVSDRAGSKYRAPSTGPAGRRVPWRFG